MGSGCLICKNFYFYKYLNTSTRCPFCYLRVTGNYVIGSFVEWFQGHATKTVVLGGSSPRTITVLEDERDRYGPPVPPKVHGAGTHVGSSLVKPKVVRKSVSIKHEVEFIEDYVRNNKGKRKKIEQWPSMEIEEDDEIKPLKSILKVGSILGKSN